MQQEFSRENYRKMKHAELSDLYSILNDETKKIASDQEAFRTYLDVQAHFDRYSVSNAILIAAQFPKALQLKTFDEWQKTETRIRKGERSIKILEPHEYRTNGGEVKKGYRIKKLFDVSQTDTEKEMQKPYIEHMKRELLKSLLKVSPVSFEAVEMLEEGKRAVYEHSQRKIYVRRGLSDDEFFKAVSLETVHARIASTEPEYRRNFYEKKSSAIAYMLQQKYGLEEKNVTLQIPQELSEKNGRDIKKELSEMRILFTEINEELKLAIKKERNLKVSERDGHEER